MNHKKVYDTQDYAGYLCAVGAIAQVHPREPSDGIAVNPIRLVKFMLLETNEQDKP